MIAYCDLAGLVRGRSVPAATFDDRLKTGVGWVPANQAICCFGPLAEPNPWGSVGDRRLLPDPATRVHVDLWDGRHPLDFVLSDAVHTDGAPGTPARGRSSAMRSTTCAPRRACA